MDSPETVGSRADRTVFQLRAEFRESCAYRISLTVRIKRNQDFLKRRRLGQLSLSIMRLISGLEKGFKSLHLDHASGESARIAFFETKFDQNCSGKQTKASSKEACFSALWIRQLSSRIDSASISIHFEVKFMSIESNGRTEDRRLFETSDENV